MGEAKRRKLADPKYGKPQRGLIVSPPIEIDGTTLKARSSNLDPQELRLAALFWDKIVWPSSRAIHFGSGPDEQFLEQVGVLTRPDYTVWGDAAQGFAQGQIKAFEELDAREPGQWCLAQGENSLLIRGGQLVAAPSPQLELHQAIPVPDKDVPLAEVLEFKQRRHDELWALRAELDDFVAAINAAEDKEDELSRHVVLVDRACADAIRVGAEWQFPVRLTNFKSTYELRPFQTLAGAFSGALGSQAIPLTATHAVLAGAIGAAAASTSTLKLSFDGFEWRGLRPRQGPYRYVYQFHRELL